MALKNPNACPNCGETRFNAVVEVYDEISFRGGAEVLNIQGKAESWYDRAFCINCQNYVDFEKTAELKRVVLTNEE